MRKLSSMTKMAIAVALGVLIGYVVFSQSQWAFLTWVPLLLVLACPLAMVFMMRGMVRCSRLVRQGVPTVVSKLRAFRGTTRGISGDHSSAF